jgi:hypothetical protein
MNSLRDIQWFDEARDRSGSTQSLIRAFVPMGYEMYLRIMFPFQAEDLSAISWREVANRFGIELTTHTGVAEITDAMWASGNPGLATMEGFSGLDADVTFLRRTLEGPRGPTEPCTFLFSNTGAEGIDPELEPVECSLGDEAVVVGVGTIAQVLYQDANYVWPSDRRWVFVTVDDSEGSGILACDRPTGEKVLNGETVEAFEVSDSDNVRFLFGKWWEGA